MGSCSLGLLVLLMPCRYILARNLLRRRYWLGGQKVGAAGCDGWKSMRACEENRMLTDYRQRIYARYGENFQDAGEYFDAVASTRWGKSYHYYLRGWLPSNH